ncbi:TetR family transcriptional regulator [Nocardia sp. SYP-A9097]|uniref:TetR/AcrR family transcriptional regulator n=1 Tax=Nocardia sp. SYP-A9097 TaxID=2663237 RepID=UPI00129A90C5|nr:TetR/AcrR family transcriptional regulator [Nocardia sp. SYP-A9097]MRH87484.1 TetR family transcriptional regulator [Nocardia sp. SYP-A9097]
MCVSTERRVNRGPSAAADNRAALIAAAREVFAETGFHAPLSRIARVAGVGQGSLYRHFPDRDALALAVFESNVEALETFAAAPAASLDDLLAEVIEQLPSAMAIVAGLDSSADPRLAALADRIRAVLAAKLEAARPAGAWRPDLAPDEVMLALAMLAALLTHTEPATRLSRAHAAWALLCRGLR